MDELLEKLGYLINGENFVVDYGEYNEMLIAKTERENMLDFLFQNVKGVEKNGHLIFDMGTINAYLKAVYPHRYQRALNEQRNKSHED